MYSFYGCLFFVSLVILCKGNEYHLQYFEIFTFCIGGCPTTPLFAFVQNSTVVSTMSTVGGYNLSYAGANSNTVSPGSFVLMKCNSGYVLQSGQLNITCIDDTWTTFPHCTSIGTGVEPAARRLARDTSACVIDLTTTFNITNGYLLSSSLSFISTTAATGD